MYYINGKNKILSNDILDLLIFLITQLLNQKLQTQEMKKNILGHITGIKWYIGN